MLQNDSSTQQKTMNLPQNPLVLIVEDDLTLEPVWNFLLSQAHPGATLLWATSERSAHRILQRCEVDGHPVSLVIADIFLDGTRTGLDLWREHATPAMPVLVMSGLASHRLPRLLERGETHPPFYLQKPLNPVRCLEVLKFYLSADRDDDSQP
jgi:CheY-like chemotaxis protein